MALTKSFLDTMFNSMNKFVPDGLSIALLVLSSLAAVMGCYLVADKAVWIAFLQVLLLDQLPVEFIINVSDTIRIPFWDSLYDRFAFLSVNDPLLI